MRPVQEIKVDFLIYGEIGYPSDTSDLKNTFSRPYLSPSPYQKKA